MADMLNFRSLAILTLVSFFATTGFVQAQRGESKALGGPQSIPLPKSDNFPQTKRPPRRIATPQPNTNNSRDRKRNRNQKQKKAPQVEVDLSFGADPNSPVFVLDFAGGFRVKQPDGFVPSSALEIFPDGRIVTGRKSLNVKEVVGQMDPVELQAFLVFATEDCRFFDFTTDSIKADMQQAANSIIVMDAATTQMTINLDKHKQQTPSKCGRSNPSRQ